MGPGAVVWFASNLVWLNIVAQLLNVFLMLRHWLVGGVGDHSLAEPYRLRGWYFGLIVAVCAIVSAVGFSAACGL